MTKKNEVVVPVTVRMSILGVNGYTQPTILTRVSRGGVDKTAWVLKNEDGETVFKMYGGKEKVCEFLDDLGSAVLAGEYKWEHKENK